MLANLPCLAGIKKIRFTGHTRTPTHAPVRTQPGLKQIHKNTCIHPYTHICHVTDLPSLVGLGLALKRPQAATPAQRETSRQDRAPSCCTGAHRLYMYISAYLYISIIEAASSAVMLHGSSPSFVLADGVAAGGDSDHFSAAN